MIELHGALAEVSCLACGAREDRETLQHRLLLNYDGQAENIPVSDLVTDCLSVLSETM